MKKSILLLLTVLFTLGLVAFTNEYDTQTTSKNSDNNQTTKPMNSYVSIFEIPATDLSRAIRFYEALLELKIEKYEIPGMEMGVLPYEDQAVTGVILKAEGYEPSPNGITIYLNGGKNLQNILDRVEPNGGKILLKKTPHADESGFFALFLDSEGNRMGLHSTE